MIGPGEMEYAVRDGGVRVAGALGAEFPYAPVVCVFFGEEGEEGGKRVAVGASRVGGGGAGGGDYCRGSRC